MKVKLGKVSDSCLGKMLDAEKNKGEYQPYLANINVRWGGFDLKNLSKMRFEPHEEERYGLKKGDLIICEGGEPGRCAVWEEQILNMKIQKALHRVRVHDCVDNYYLYYWMNLAGKMGWLKRHFTETTIKHLPGDKLAEIEIDLPELSVQKKISRTLHLLDEKFQNNNRIISELQSTAKTIYDYWFAQYDFPNAEGQPYRTSEGEMVWNEQIKRHVPKEWSKKNFGDMLLLCKDGTHNPPARIEVGIPLLTGTMFGQSFLVYDKATYISQNDYNAIHSTYQPQVSDFVITKIGSVGSVNLLREKDIPIAIHCNSALLRFKSNIPVSYAFFFLKSNAFQASLRREITKTVQDFVSLDRLSSIHVTMPPIPLLESFAKIADPVLDEIKAKTEENELLSTMRDWLLPMLMNGQVTVE